MPVPPPLHDPVQIEARLLVVSEMLDRAVEEVRRAMAEIKAGPPPAPQLTPPAPLETDRPESDDHE